MTNKTHNLNNIVILVILLAGAIFAPTAFFYTLDNVNEKRISITPKNDSANISENLESNDNDIENLKQMTQLIDNSSTKNLLALQKKKITDSELKGLEIEISKLYDCGLIKGISLDTLSDSLVYVAYYNVTNPTSESENVVTLSVKEYKFSDYADFEYSFWVGSESGKIYEVTIIDDGFDFSLSDIEYMNGVSKYYGIDNISPFKQEEDNHIAEFQISIEDYQTTSYYKEFSIYNSSEGSFVRKDSGIKWSILSRSLEENKSTLIGPTNFSDQIAYNK